MPNFTGEGLHHLAGAKLTELRLYGVRVTDEGLADIKKLPRLVRLELQSDGKSVRYTDKGLRHISEMYNLETLRLSGPGVTGAGLEALRGMRILRDLSLSNVPNVKGPDLEHVTGMSRLEILHLYHTEGTDEALKHISRLKYLWWVELPQRTTPAVLEYLKDLPKLSTLTVPSGWSPEDVARAKRMFPKVDVEVFRRD